MKTLFWVDNLDKKIESEKGGSCINMTVMTAFQEFHKKKVSIEKTKSRKLVINEVSSSIPIKSYEKQEPVLSFSKYQHLYSQSEMDLFGAKYFFWGYLHHVNSFSQVYLSFPGWLVNMRAKQVNVPLKKTVETYLPPLSTKVTDPVTISELVWDQRGSVRVRFSYTMGRFWFTYNMHE